MGYNMGAAPAPAPTKTIVTAYGLNGIEYTFSPGVHWIFPYGEPAVQIPNVETAIRVFSAIPNPSIYPAYASSFYKPIHDRYGNALRDTTGNFIYYFTQLAGGGYKHTRRRKQHKQKKQTRHRQQKTRQRTVKQRRRRILKTAKKRRTN
jgi:hypothetical protein